MGGGILNKKHEKHTSVAVSGLKSSTVYPYKITATSTDGGQTTFDGLVFKTKVSK